jgi:hypothetical protein
MLTAIKKRRNKTYTEAIAAVATVTCGLLYDFYSSF